MRLLLKLHFWMLVYLVMNLIPVIGSTLAFSAQTNKNPKAQIKTELNSDTDISGSENINKRESTGLAYPANQSPLNSAEINQLKTTKHLEVHEKANYGLSLGIMRGNTINSNEATQPFMFGFNLNLPKSTEDYDFEINLQTDHAVHFIFSQRWKVYDQTFMGPYIKAGFADYIDSGDSMAAIININHYKIRTALGFSDFLFMSEIYYTELGIAYGVTGLCGDLKFGTQLAF